MSKIETFHWHRQPAIDAALRREFADSIGPGKQVVDVGAGYDPWPYATEFVDREAWPQLAGRKVHALDVELDRLPYADKSVDFLYCRHTIEDLHNPTLLLREINRVAKAGYIETPSPIAEFCRGSNSGGCLLRGCPHHFWLAWQEGGILHVLPKSPFIQTATVPCEIDAAIVQMLADPDRWHTRFGWRGRLDFKILKHRIDFDFIDQSTYLAILGRAFASCGLISQAST